MIKVHELSVEMSGMVLHEGDKLVPGNPFVSDYYNMGTTLGANVTVMYDTFPKDRMTHLIVVNTETGERLVIDFPKQVPA
jgi:hypothetical protein